MAIFAKKRGLDGRDQTRTAVKGRERHGPEEAGSADVVSKAGFDIEAGLLKDLRETLDLGGSCRPENQPL
jgi:hypothetical protein